MLLNNRVYNFLKRLVQIGLPALASAYFALAQLWHLSMVEEVVGTITIVTTLLGILLGISSSAYKNSDEKYDGVFIAEDTEDGSQLRLKNVDMNALNTKSEVLFKMET